MTAACRPTKPYLPDRTEVEARSQQRPVFCMGEMLDSYVDKDLCALTCACCVEGAVIFTVK